MNNKELDKIIDDVSAGIRSESLDSNLISEAVDRVWARLNTGEARSLRASQRETAAAIGDHIEGCADFQSLIPAYLKGNLSEARSLLLVDHTHECIPCRKAMKEARVRRAGTQTPAKANRSTLRPVILRWGIAAALVIG